jgi:hypothetical protein
MWLAAVTLAIQDATLPIDTARRSAEFSVSRTRRWLSTDSRDLRLVLELAGLEPGWFLTRALPVLVERWAELDAGLALPRRHGRQPAAEARQDAIRPRGASPPDSLTPRSALLAIRRRPGKDLEEAGPRAQGRDRGCRPRRIMPDNACYPT